MAGLRACARADNGPTVKSAANGANPVSNSLTGMARMPVPMTAAIEMKKQYSTFAHGSPASSGTIARRW